jgi:parallel beta-helix repeat protein
VHHIGQGMLSDMGGIYTLGVQPGTVIRNNVFHDIEKYSGGYGGWGIYTDEGSSGILVENNLVYRTSTAGFHQHYGRENIVRNNIFAWGREAQIMRTREEDHRSFTFERNIVLWNQGDLLGSNWSNNQYLFDHNLYFDARQKPLRFKDWSWDEWQKRGQDVHSMVADPRFADAANGNFALKSGSPAAQIGFALLNLSQVGPRKVARD